MNNLVLGQNIKRMRKVRGFNQKAVYQSIPLSRQAYSNIENGKSEPKTSTLIKIAQVLNKDIQDFLVEPINFRTMRFRTNKIITEKEKMKKEEILLNLSFWLQNYNFLEKLLNEKIDFIFDKNNITDPLVLAKKVREKLKLDNIEPIFDICGLADNISVKIFLFKYELVKFFGFSLGKQDNGPVIAVNTNEKISIERQIFTIAHELGHLLMHKDSYNSELFEENQKEEIEADQFAAHFLLPNDGFLKELKKVSGLHWIDQILHIKRIYKISYKTVLRRLIELNYADKDIYKEFAIAYQKKYYQNLKDHFEPNSIEPDKLLKSDFMSERLNRLVRKTYENGLITINRASEILNISLNEMKELTSSWNEIKYA
jgi:Zn-dependent peptidase ImmA (M78 family)/DNA-binding XRE family transcriptional regulator